MSTCKHCAKVTPNQTLRNTDLNILASEEIKAKLQRQEIKTCGPINTSSFKLECGMEVKEIKTSTVLNFIQSETNNNSDQRCPRIVCTEGFTWEPHMRWAECEHWVSIDFSLCVLGFLKGINYVQYFTLPLMTLWLLSFSYLSFPHSFIEQRENTPVCKWALPPAASLPGCSQCWRCNPDRPQGGSSSLTWTVAVASQDGCCQEAGRVRSRSWASNLAIPHGMQEPTGVLTSQ